MEENYKNIIDDVCNAWKKLDADLIIKHLDVSFVYDSQWVLESLTYETYINYIRKKFEAISKSRSKLRVSIVDDNYFTDPPKMIKLDQEGKIAYLRIKIKNNKIVKGDMCMF